MIDFVDAGGKVNDSSAGATNSTLIADLLAGTNFQSAADTPSMPLEKGGPHIYFPPGNYYFDQTITINKTVTLRGQDAATRAGHQTAFIFPANTQGLIINSHDTNNLSTVPEFSIPGGSGTTIEGIIFKGARGSSYTGHHGILIRAYCILRNVGVQQFGGHGIYVYANGGSGQASNCMFIGCSAENSAGSGLRLEGSDANIITVEGGDYSNNRDWGIEDRSGLGCTFSGIHMTGNGWGQNGVVWYNNLPWVLRPYKTNGEASATQPGTNESVWTRYFEDVAGGRPTWPNVTGVRSCGAFITLADAAESTWTGCYTEGSQSGSFLGKKAISVGGDHGAGIYAIDMVGSGEACHLRAVGQELTTRTSIRTKSLHLGLTRDRGDQGKGMKMSAASGPPTFASIYSQRAYLDYAWRVGDIIWNENRTQTQAGVTPPLGWRCVPGSGDPPGQFEEIPFPTAADGSATIADNGATNAKLADMPQNTIKGRVSGTGDPQDLTPAQTRSVIASDTNNGNLFLAGDGTFKAPSSGGNSWTVDYVSNRPSWYNLTPANMTHVVFNTSANGFHRIFLQDVTNGTRVKLTRLRGGQPVEVNTSDTGMTLSRKTGTVAQPTVADGGTVFLTKVAASLWVGEGDFEN